MSFTFGIVTDWSEPNRVYHMIDMIKREMRPYAYDWDIIICGGLINPNAYAYIEAPNVTHVLYSSWITKKKNAITYTSNKDIIVMMHDYFILQPGWMWAYKNFGFDWDICSNPQLLMNGKRHFTDWVNWDAEGFPRYHSFDYDDWTHTKNQYISGGYFLAKRKVLLDNTFNEDYIQGMPEDVEWSMRVRDRYVIKCNKNAVVRHNKIHRDCHD